MAASASSSPVQIPHPSVAVTGGGGVPTRTWLRTFDQLSKQALGGTVTQVVAGAGLAGGVITVNGTIELLGPGTETLTSDGQLLIGDSVTGAAQANTLTPGANVTITNGPGTIEIAAAGGGVGLTTNGELWIGDTGAGQGVAGTLTAGTGVSVTNGAGSITIASPLTPGRGISVSGGVGALMVAAQIPAIEQTASANPTGTISLTPVMMGLAGTITPVFSTRIRVTINGSCASDTLADGGTVQISYGTGTAPVNGAAVTGTQIGSAQEWTEAVAGVLIPFSVSAVISGLTVGTAYWLDAAVSAITGGTATISRVCINAVEV